MIVKTKSIQLEELTCPSCINKIEAAVGKMEGVSEVKVMFNSSKVKATFNEEITNEEQIKKIITNLGYEVLE